MAARNPPWARDELILALNLYVKHSGRDLPSHHPDIESLSEILNKLPIHPQRPDAERFRNPNGVRMKLMNFRRLDPSFEGVGLNRGGYDEETVWLEFAHDPQRLASVASAIESGVELAPSSSFEGEEEYAEGRVLYRLHRLRERDSKLVTVAKHRFEKKNGRLYCECCGFDFHQTYGELGKGYIEAHHILPVCEMMPGAKTRAQDLAMVCANCHRMLHRAQPLISVNELRERLCCTDQ